jgi:hypothetical protein
MTVSRTTQPTLEAALLVLVNTLLLKLLNGASCNLHTLHIAQEISSTVLTLHSLQHSVQEWRM